MATLKGVQEVNIDDVLLEWLDDETSGTIKDFERWAKRKKISYPSIELAYALTRLIQNGKMRIVAPFGEFHFTRG